MDKVDFIKKCRDDRVFFAEHLLYSEDGTFYKLEEHQEMMIGCEDSHQVYFLGRRMGKSFILATLCLHEALFRKYAKVFILSPTETQAKELAETITGLIERSKIIEAELTTNNVMEKKFRNGSRIVIRTAGGKGNVSSLVGSGANLLVIDEIQDVQDVLINKILPVLRGQKGKSKFIVAGTPRAKAGFLWDSLQNGRKIWNDGEWKFDDSNDGNFTVFRKQTAYLNSDDQIVRSGTPRITVDELKEDMNNMPLIEFKQEYCLEFMSSISDVYPEELQSQIFNGNAISIPTYPFGSKKNVVWGLDVGKMRNETVLSIAEVDNAIEYRNLNGESVTEEYVEENYNNIREVHYKTLNIKWYKMWELGTDYENIEKYILYELPRYFPNIRRGVIDATGVGEPIAEQIQKHIKKTTKPYPIESYKFSKESKKAVVEFGVKIMERGDVKLLYNQRLQREMTGYKRKLTDSNNFIYEKAAGSDDYIDSINLCIYNISLGLRFSPPAFVKPIPKIIAKTFGCSKWQQERNQKNKKIINNPRRRF